MSEQETTNAILGHISDLLSATAQRAREESTAALAAERERSAASLAAERKRSAAALAAEQQRSQCVAAALEKALRIEQQLSRSRAERILAPGFGLGQRDFAAALEAEQKRSSDLASALDGARAGEEQLQRAYATVSAGFQSLEAMHATAVERLDEERGRSALFSKKCKQLDTLATEVDGLLRFCLVSVQCPEMEVVSVDAAKGSRATLSRAILDPRVQRNLTEIIESAHAAGRSNESSHRAVKIKSEPTP
ncbi:hypothetical protein TeGR_g6133 [Tetraparma gracilis]|uniref:Uncharacterized protein n=1 Tax=Tetraparma gracilis TaxID=2962635 RepID=A0ABQ6M4L0_9STRA|nr:hypothetical protein TeGR_g6133 [Tetraparma gracilis]